MDGIDRLHGIAEDVGRTVWLRDLGAALSETADAIEGGTSDPSGYESEVLAWVEKNGGLEAVKERTMPEDMSWPFYEDGEPVRLGEHWQQDGYDWSITSIDSIEFAEDGVRFENEYADAFYRYGERVKRPAPPVLDADGVEIREGDTVYHVKDGSEMTVCGIEGEWLVVSVGGRVRHDIVTHRAPVLAADGEPLEVGQTVWNVVTGREYTVRSCTNGGAHLSRDGKPDGYCRAEYLTHQRPVMDSDGNRIEPAMDVWWVCEGDERGIHAEKLHVESIGDDGFVTCSPFNGGTWVELEPSELYVHKPVLDADGVPIKVGDTVYLLPGEWCGEYPLRGYSAGDEMVVKELYSGHECEGVLRCAGDGKCNCFPLPCQLTHTKPEPDSWSSVWADVSNGNETPEGMMRRCRALARRGE